STLAWHRCAPRVAGGGVLDAPAGRAGAFCPRHPAAPPRPWRSLGTLVRIVAALSETDSVGDPCLAFARTAWGQFRGRRGTTDPTPGDSLVGRAGPRGPPPPPPSRRNPAAAGAARGAGGSVPSPDPGGSP